MYFIAANSSVAYHYNVLYSSKRRTLPLLSNIFSDGSVAAEAVSAAINLFDPPIQCVFIVVNFAFYLGYHKSVSMATIMTAYK